jgi:hypothetical protein
LGGGGLRELVFDVFHKAAFERVHVKHARCGTKLLHTWFVDMFAMNNSESIF